jgi:hypothetical protein
MMAEPEVAFLLFSKFAEANEDEMRALLGGVTVQSLAHEISPATLDRIEQLVGLWRSLDRCFPAADEAYNWLYRPNAALAERSPWDALLAGEIARAHGLLLAEMLGLSPLEVAVIAEPREFERISLAYSEIAKAMPRDAIHRWLRQPINRLKGLTPLALLEQRGVDSFLALTSELHS